MLSIIVVNYHTWEMLAANLAPLADPGRPWEILIVDNDPAFPGADAFRRRFPSLRVLDAPGNHGFAYGCNRGAEAARGDWLLFLNPDVQASPEAILALLAAARGHPEFALWTAPQRDLRGRLQRAFGPFTSLATAFGWSRWLLRRLQPRRHPDPRTPPERLPPVLPVDWISGSLLLLRRADFDRLGGWSEDYWMYCEDEDLCRRASALGLRAAQFSGCSFIHAHGAASRSHPAIKALTKSEAILSRHVYLQKHAPGPGGRFLRAWLRLHTACSLPLWSLLDTLTAGRVPTFRLRRTLHQRLSAWYRETPAPGPLHLSPLAPRRKLASTPGPAAPLP